MPREHDHARQGRVQRCFEHHAGDSQGLPSRVRAYAGAQFLFSNGIDSHYVPVYTKRMLYSLRS